MNKSFVSNNEFVLVVVPHKNNALIKIHLQNAFNS